MSLRFISMILGGLVLSNLAFSAPTEPVQTPAVTVYGEIAARFTTTSCALPCQQPRSSDWYFWRANDRVEIRADSSEVGEIWRRDAKGQVSFVYVEPLHRRGIEYSAVDLRMIHHRRSWDELASIVPPAELAQLAPVGETEILGHKAQRYRGKLGARTLEVVWVPDLQLATQVINTGSDRQVTTELKSLLTDQDPIASISDDTLNDFQLVDFADVGDMETNESMAWLKQALAAPGHEHHDH
ncbi:MAG: hypothetical protein H6975_07580 [Gammaproteobacteria bacterium]|nr:hypothetical protein [Gammaproteobacteria bacterium]